MSTPRPLSDLLPSVLAEIEERRDSAAVSSIFPLRLVNLPEERTRSAVAEDPTVDDVWSRIYSRAA